MRQAFLTALPITMAAGTVGADPTTDWQGRYDHMMWGGGHGLLGGLAMVVFWGLVIALFVLIVKRLADGQNRDDGGRGKPDALDILRQRFAEGEIDEEEFEQRKKALDR